MKNLVVASLMLLFAFGIKAQDVVYTKADETKVLDLLAKSKKQAKGTNMILFFAKQFIGTPYVAATLEKPGKEKLVVNLSQLDCTTFVENVTALVLTSRGKEQTFKSFCDNLRRIRYRDGVIKDYTSRLHYYSSWIDSNEKMGLVKEIRLGTARQKLHINYMSTHVSSYPALVAYPNFVSKIKEEENILTGRIVKYTPSSQLSKGPKTLNYIKDGDILAMVTKKAGLDVAHLGFAVWQKGQLHLLNASSLRHKVVLETKTLRAYQLSQKSQIGIRVIRIV